MNYLRQLILFASALVLSLAAAATPLFDAAGPAAGNMRFSWIHGSVSAKANNDVRIQVHRYNAHTYILRQNPAVHWEAPFMYLLFGQDKVVLLDAGATAESDYFPLRKTVDAIIARWQTANQVSKLELVVLPLGSDASQTEGLGQFEGRDDTQVLMPNAKGRKQLFAGEDETELELGGRTLTLMPSPGLDEQAVSVYDPWSDFLLTGNAFYAGRLVIRDFDTYKQSLARLHAFAQAQPVKWVMGGRIEMSDYPGVDYRLRSNFRPREHALQMDPGSLQEAYRIVHLINGSKDIRIHADFIVMNGVGRGARDYGWPTYTPEEFRQVRLR